MRRDSSTARRDLAGAKHLSLLKCDRFATRAPHARTRADTVRGLVTFLAHTTTITTTTALADGGGGVRWLLPFRSDEVVALVDQAVRGDAGQLVPGARERGAHRENRHPQARLWEV